MDFKISDPGKLYHVPGYTSVKIRATLTVIMKNGIIFNTLGAFDFRKRFFTFDHLLIHSNFYQDE